MKYSGIILPLAALTTAFVIPDEQLTNQILIESKKPSTFLDRIQGGIDSVWAGVEITFENAKVLSSNALDSAFENSVNAAQRVVETVGCHTSMTKFPVQEWLDSASTDEEEEFDLFEENHPHKPPHHKHPKHPHHGPHKPNQTIYEMISASKYTTKLAELVDKYPDLVSILNGTAANYTLFAPTDKAFEKIPKGHKKPSDEVIKKVLAYHLSPNFLPGNKLWRTHTIPTALGEDSLGGEPQRLRVSFSLLRGLHLNFYSKVVAANIFATNGVIHGVDSLLLPPPSAIEELSIFPSEFSTLVLGLEKTGLYAAIEESPHTGGTLFAPSNWAFRKLGPKINAFLFSKYGEKYLKALLEYHVVANQTLYSDAFYKGKSESQSEIDTDEDKDRGFFHVDLPTLLKDRSLSIDVAHFGRYIKFRINGFSSVALLDGIAKDGVIHVVSQVLLPPKQPGGEGIDWDEVAEGEDVMDLEEFKERLIPYLAREDEL